MEFSDLIRKRYSVRAYQQVPVEESKLHKVLETACLAPTACNLQPFRILVIPTAGHAEELSQIYRQPWFSEAPFVIGICADIQHGWKRKDGKNYAEVDAAIAMDHLILAATEQGLGTCWVAAFNEQAARRWLSLPSGWEPIAFTPLGYPAGSPRNKIRKKPEELVLFHHWPTCGKGTIRD